MNKIHLVLFNMNNRICGANLAATRRILNSVMDDAAPATAAGDKTGARVGALQNRDQMS
jgi:hypothetical protein